MYTSQYERNPLEDTCWYHKVIGFFSFCGHFIFGLKPASRPLGVEQIPSTARKLGHLHLFLFSGDGQIYQPYKIKCVKKGVNIMHSLIMKVRVLPSVIQQIKRGLVANFFSRKDRRFST